MPAERDRRWLAAIEREPEAGHVFIAAGAAHLPGSAGPIELLRQRGWTVTRVD